MKETSAAEYQSSPYLKLLAVSEAKVGKTCSLVAQCLGVFPGQKYGGVVDKPENLHVIALDSGAAAGIQKFLTQSCGASKEALNFRIYNMQDDVAAVSKSEDGWDYTLYNTLMQVLNRIDEKTRKGGTHAVIVSSLSTLAQTIKRSLAGNPVSKSMRGVGMDRSKWDAFGNQIAEIRSLVQSGNWHTIWEGHIVGGGPTDESDDKGQGSTKTKETLAVQGKAGAYFSQNVEQILRIRRMYGERLAGTKVERVIFDTQPSLEFIAAGRSFNEMLDAKEQDLTVVCHKLGLKIGRWGAKKEKAA